MEKQKEGQAQLVFLVGKPAGVLLEHTECLGAQQEMVKAIDCESIQWNSVPSF